MDFVLGGMVGGLTVVGYLVVLALYDWIDTRAARHD